jgi:hypothetical protein
MFVMVVLNLIEIVYHITILSGTLSNISIVAFLASSCGSILVSLILMCLYVYVCKSQELESVECIEES